MDPKPKGATILRRTAKAGGDRAALQVALSSLIPSEADPYKAQSLNDILHTAGGETVAWTWTWVIHSALSGQKRAASNLVLFVAFWQIASGPPSGGLCLKPCRPFSDASEPHYRAHQEASY